MTSMNGDLTWAAALIAGVSGSMHCLAMCGGISSALGMRARAQGHSAPQTFKLAVLYHLGRLCSYALIGALFGFIGSGLLNVLNLLASTNWLRVAAGVLLLLLGGQLLFGWRVLAAVERVGQAFWRQWLPLMHQRHISKPALQAILLGALWGWLPCGLVYSMLLFSALGGSARHGALTMAAFGLGTLPMMLSSSLLAGQWQRLLAQRGRQLGGITLIALGVWTIYIALRHAHSGS